MRSYVGAHGAPIAAVVLATGVALSGCSAEEDPAQGASASAVPSSAALDPREEEEPEDTFADVEEPATVPMPAGRQPGVRAVNAWEGAKVLDGKDPIAAELVLGPSRAAVLLVNSVDGLSARGSGEAELRYWRKRNLFTEGPVEVMDPVVVDGVEMQHARGSSAVDLVDWFVYAVDDLTVEVLFFLPLDFSEEEREEYIGQVMATLEFE